MRDPALSVEPIDYIQHWRALVQARNDQGRRLDPQHGRGDHWAGPRAERFLRFAALASSGPDPFLEIVRTAITPKSTVLDVGAGTGRHVLALAPQVAHVVAVEPSPAMREQLAAGLAEANLQNVTIVDDGWPDARVDDADLVICSHVVYFAEEIERFVRRLYDVARRGYIVARFQQRELAILDLFDQVWGEPRCFEPTVADLFGVACQLGIWPSVAKIPFLANAGFDSIDDAVTLVRADLLNPDHDGVEETIRDHVTDRTVWRDGKLFWDLPPMSAGVLWWDRATS